MNKLSKSNKKRSVDFSNLCQVQSKLQFLTNILSFFCCLIYI